MSCNVNVSKLNLGHLHATVKFKVKLILIIKPSRPWHLKATVKFLGAAVV
jgi:hypothetical protein